MDLRKLPSDFSVLHVTTLIVTSKDKAYGVVKLIQIVPRTCDLQTFGHGNPKISESSASKTASHLESRHRLQSEL